MASRPGIQELVVHMPEQLHAELKAKAQDEDITMSQIVRRLVRDYVKGEKR